jgi:putative hemolysin
VGTYCGSSHRSRGVSFGGMIILVAVGLVILAWAAIGISLAAPQASQHAIERHGEAAVLVADCASQGNILKTMHNPATNRKAQICGLPDGKLGVLITSCDNACITAFVKEKMDTVEKVVKYLQNAGYELFQ